MRKYLFMFTTLLGIYSSMSVQAAQNSEYEVKMPEQSLLRSEEIESYSQRIRELNQEEVEKLPQEEQQDAISAVLQVISDLNRDEIDAITEMKKESVGGLVDSDARRTTTIEWQNYGDILITLDSKTLGWNHGHAGIVDYNKNTVIEANPGEGVKSKVSYRTYWAKVNTDELYVGGATQSNYKTAVNYAAKQIGKPYTILTTLNSTDQWYCSKLVYKAWLNAGYNVGDHYKDSSWSYDIVGVTPKQILWDDNVFFYQKVK